MRSKNGTKNTNNTIREGGRLRSYRYNKLLTFVIIFGIVGAIIIISAQAATPNINIEPESASINSPAKRCSDVSGSNGGCVQFKKALSDGFVGLNTYNRADFTKLKNDTGIQDLRMDDPSAATFTAAKNLGITILPNLDYNYYADGGGGSDGHNGVPDSYISTWATNKTAEIKSAVESSGVPVPEAIEIYNEPWNCTFWHTPAKLSDKAPIYLKLVKVTANKIWALGGSWSDTKILVAADTIDTACSTANSRASGDADWRRPLLAADDADPDHILKDSRIHPTVHPYTQDRPPDQTDVAGQPTWWDFNRYIYAYNDFKTHGNPDPTVWITEYGWRSFGTDSVGESNQAQYTFDAITMMQTYGKIDKTYAWLYGTGSSLTAYGENWLDSSNTCKPICAKVKNYINNH